jgi:integrase
MREWQADILDSPYVFLGAWRGQKPSIIGETTLDNWLKKLQAKTGVRLSFHRLRRTFGRMAHRAGVPISEIQVTLGHSSPTMTARYIGADIEATARATMKVEEYLSALKTPQVGQTR